MHDGPGDKPPETAFRELFRAHAAFVWRVLRRYGVHDAELPDVCQEVFMVVHRRLPEFEGRAQLRTWIYEIARRSALAQVRRSARQAHQVPLDEAPLCSDTPGPEQQLSTEGALTWLRWALQQLDERKREALVLYELEEMTLSEVALALGCGTNTVHYRVLRAREELSALSRRAGGSVTAPALAQLKACKESR